MKTKTKGQEDIIEFYPTRNKWGGKDNYTQKRRYGLDRI